MLAFLFRPTARKQNRQEEGGRNKTILFASLWLLVKSTAFQSIKSAWIFAIWLIFGELPPGGGKYMNPFVIVVDFVDGGYRTVVFRVILRPCFYHGAGLAEFKLPKVFWLEHAFVFWRWVFFCAGPNAITVSSRHCTAAGRSILIAASMAIASLFVRNVIWLAECTAAERICGISHDRRVPRLCASPASRRAFYGAGGDHFPQWWLRTDFWSASPRSGYRLAVLTEARPARRWLSVPLRTYWHTIGFYGRSSFQPAFGSTPP